MTAKPWLNLYPKGVPEEIHPGMHSSLVDMLNRACKKYSGSPCLENFGHQITYHQLNRLSNAFSSYLQQHLGMMKGERFAIMLPNLLQYTVALWGALKAGLVVVNVNPLYTARELKHQLNDAGVTGVLVLENFATVLEEVMDETSVKHVITTELGDAFPTIKKYITNCVVKYVKKMVPRWRIAGSTSYIHALKVGQRLKFKRVEVNSDDVAFLQYTGGTTGVSKGAVLTHRNMLANVFSCAAWMNPTLTKNKETVVVALPLYHIFSLTVCHLSFIYMGQLGVLITNPRDIDGFSKLLKKRSQPFTTFVGVNTLYNALVNNKVFRTLNFSRLKTSISGGAALQPVVAEKWKQVTGGWIMDGYGLTEASPVLTINPVTRGHFTGSIGLPVPSTDLAIMDDAGNRLPAGEIGEICGFGPQIMSGYWKRPVETAEVITKEGWLRTGDIGRMDEQGNFFIVDRKKDMIIVSGFNVYPNEVEEVISTMPEVLEVAVIGIPNAEGSGETVKAFVVKKDDVLTDVMIKEYCYANLTRYKVPKTLQFVDALPKSNVGKILRRELRDQAINTVELVQ